MENRRGDFAPAPVQRLTAPLFGLFYLLFFTILAGGCAAPGEPIERKPPTPNAVNDLAAAQIGNDVTLSFTLPRESIEKRPLQQALTIEIYRDFAVNTTIGASNAAASHSHPTLILTVPPSMVDHYSAQGHIRLTDALTAEVFTQNPIGVALYTVRTFVSPKKRSADSNLASVAIHPAPDPIADLKAEITPAGVTLSWTPPQKTLIGPAPQIAGYRVYRAELSGAQAGAPGAASGAAAQAATETPAQAPPFARIAEPTVPPYTDTQAQLGKTYIYTVRSLAQYPLQPPGKYLESLDSNSVTITPEDIFPPSAPQNLVVVFVPAAAGAPAHLELSWAISPETDIAGYNVYRSEDEAARGARINSELLLTPAFRDMNVAAARRYFYRVSAVDRSGNEGPAGAPASGSVAAENQ